MFKITKVLNTKIRFQTSKIVLIHITISHTIQLYEDIDNVAIVLLVSPHFVPD